MSRAVLGDAQAGLERLNQYRARHQAVRLAWSQPLVQAAQGWANYLVAQGCGLERSDAEGVGQTLVVQYFNDGTPDSEVQPSLMAAADAWYSTQVRRLCHALSC